MRFSLLLTLLAALCSTAAIAAREGEPGQFDYYLLNLSWEPEFCHSPRNADSEECRHPRGLVVHGLWPQYTQGYPEHCGNARRPANPDAYLDIMPTSWLLQHEWSTHGTCSGLAPDAYFSAIRRAFTSIRIPEALKKPRRMQSLPPSVIKQQFVAANPGLRPDAMAISCGHNFLTAVEFCLNKKDFSYTSCEGLRECRANTIRIAPVQ